jgi:hypothetical protein
MKNIRPLLSVLVTAGVALAQATAWADSAASIQTQASGTAATYDDAGSGNFPIVTAVLSHPGSLDGYTYANWAYLAADTTGSMELFYNSTLTGPAGSYPNPTVGDTIAASGVYSPFHGIPEIANGTPAINVSGPGSQGNAPYAPGAPVVTTIPTINVGTTLPAGGGVNASGLAGYYLQLNNVTISDVSLTGSSPYNANWLVHNNNQGIITDGSANSMVMYLYASSYSDCGAIAASGGLIPTGLVDMTGFVDDFYTSSTGVTEAEFVPVSITSVPEPSAMALGGLGSALAWVCYRLRKKA